MIHIVRVLIGVFFVALIGGVIHLVNKDPQMAFQGFLIFLACVVTYGIGWFITDMVDS